ncbi:hypothetical protein [Priestia megaterium]|nr:hypothetical protein [Priestia megaterium]
MKSEQVERLIVYMLGESELIPTIKQAIENKWKGSIQTSVTFS